VSDETWGDPEPIELSDTPGAFPTHVLPPAFRRMVQAVAANKQVPEALPAMMGFSAAGILAGPRVAITRGHGWVEPLTSYTVTAMESGTGKSPAEKDVTRPLRKIHKRIRAECTDVLNNKLDELEAERARLALSAKKEERDIERRIEELKDAPEPRVLFGSDTTVEALASLMATNGGCGGIMDGEGEFFGILSGRYSGQVPNLGLALKAYDGDYYEVGRIGRRQADMERAVLGLGLAVQPSVLMEAAKSKAMRERGLLARFLIAVPPNILGTRAPEGAPYDHEAMDLWEAALEHIAAMPLADPESGEVPMLVLSEQARKLHIEFKAWMEPRLHPDDGELGDLPGWASKHVGRVMRLAGLLHLLSGQGLADEVAERPMRSAISAGRWAIPHAVTAFGWDGVPGEVGEQHCKAMLTAIRRKNMTDWAGQREYHRAVKNQAWVKQGGAVAVLKTLEELVDLRWLTVATRRDGSGRETVMYRPHPSVADPEAER
jgi:replicative DNA helicase